MKNIKLLLVALVLFSVCKTSFGQFTFGGKLGVNMSNLVTEESTDLKSKLGMDIGLYSEFGLNDKFAFQLALTRNEKGAKAEEGDVKIKSQLSYFEVQPSLIYFHKIKSTTLYASAGPYYAFFATGQLKANKKMFGLDGNSKTESISMGSDDNDQFKSTDYGLNLSLGLNLKDNGRIGIQYELGLANISNADNSEVKNKSVSIFITYPYTFGKKN